MLKRKYEVWLQIEHLVFGLVALLSATRNVEHNRVRECSLIDFYCLYKACYSGSRCRVDIYVFGLEKELRCFFEFEI